MTEETKTKTKKLHLADYVDEFAAELKERLNEVEPRWKDAWLKAPRSGQFFRIMKSLSTCYNEWRFGEDKQYNYTDAIGNLFICWLRDKHPELSKEWKTEDITSRDIFKLGV